MTVEVAGRRRSVASLAIHDAEKAARGELVVESQVVEKIAARVAVGVDGVGAPAGGASRWLGRSAARPVPRVRATLRDGRADLDVEVGLRYPGPVAETCDRLRSRLLAAVPRLAGIPVERIDILVSGMVRDPGTGGRR